MNSTARPKTAGLKLRLQPALQQTKARARLRKASKPQYTPVDRCRRPREGRSPLTVGLVRGAPRLCFVPKFSKFLMWIALLLFFWFICLSGEDSHITETHCIHWIYHIYAPYLIHTLKGPHIMLPLLCSFDMLILIPSSVILSLYTIFSVFLSA